MSCLDGARARPTLIALEGAPATIAYAGDWVDVDEEAALVSAAEAAADDWVAVRGRRLRRLGGPAGERGFAPEPLPRWASELCAAVGAAAGAGEPGRRGRRRPNHVLVNAYAFSSGDPQSFPPALFSFPMNSPNCAGNRYVLAHADGPAYDDRTCALSCGADCVVTFQRRLAPGDVGVVDAGPPCRVLLRRRSLLVFSGYAYVARTHAIAAGADVLGADVANLAAAGAAAGDVVARVGTRHSFTLRHAWPVD